MTPAAPSKNVPAVCLAPAALLVAEVAAAEADEAAADPEAVAAVPFGDPPPTKLADTPVLFVQCEL